MYLSYTLVVFYSCLRLLISYLVWSQSCSSEIRAVLETQRVICKLAIFQWNLEMGRIHIRTYLQDNFEINKSYEFIILIQVTKLYTRNKFLKGWHLYSNLWDSGASTNSYPWKGSENSPLQEMLALPVAGEAPTHIRPENVHFEGNMVPKPGSRIRTLSRLRKRASSSCYSTGPY